MPNYTVAVPERHVAIYTGVTAESAQEALQKVAEERKSGTGEVVTEFTGTAPMSEWSVVKKED